MNRAPVKWRVLDSVRSIFAWPPLQIVYARNIRAIRVIRGSASAIRRTWSYGGNALIPSSTVLTIASMITVILKTESGEEIARVGRPGNEATLRRKGPQFRLLSELTPFSPDAFNRDDVPEGVKHEDVKHEEG